MSDNKISSTRRKVLRASAAAMPMVATFKSGAAMAASSAMCNPLSEKVSNKNFPGSASDSAVRYSVPTYKKLKPKNKESDYIYDIDGQLFRHNGRKFTGKLSNFEKLPEGKQANVLMLYDDDDSGTYEVGLWPRFKVDYPYSSSSQFPINASCLTSIAVSGTNGFRGL